MKISNFLFTVMSVLVLLTSCSDDDKGVAIDDGTTIDTTTSTIWSGATTTFTKSNNADFTQAANQDRITDNVWITRGNSQGLFNIATETGYSKGVSPIDTEWAYGTTADAGNLTYNSWQETVANNPSGAVGKDMVLHLITDDILIDIKFLSWSKKNGGGFSYERSTAN